MTIKSFHFGIMLAGFSEFVLQIEKPVQLKLFKQNYLLTQFDI